MGAVVPYIPQLIGAATAVYSAKQAKKGVKLPTQDKEAPTVDLSEQQLALQRDAKRRSATQGRQGTVLSERSTLG